VAHWYVFLAALLFVKVVVLTNMLATGGVASCKEGFPQALDPDGLFIPSIIW
jgi:hypothetical protein